MAYIVPDLCQKQQKSQLSRPGFLITEQIVIHQPPTSALITWFIESSTYDFDNEISLAIANTSDATQGKWEFEHVFVRTISLQYRKIFCLGWIYLHFFMNWRSVYFHDGKLGYTAISLPMVLYEQMQNHWVESKGFIPFRADTFGDSRSNVHCFRGRLHS